MDVSCQNEATGLMLHQQLGEYLDTEIWTDLGENLDKLLPPSRAIRLDRLEVDLASIQTTDWKRQLKQKLLEQVRIAIEKIPETVVDQGSNTSKTQGDQSLMESYLYFLKNGHFPWWASEIRLDLMETELLEKEEKQFLNQCQTLLESDQNAQSRFVLQSGDALFWAYSSGLMPSLKPYRKFGTQPRKLILALLKKDDLASFKPFTEVQIRTVIRSIILECLTNKHFDLESVKRSIITRMVQGSGSNIRLETKDKVKEQSIPKEPDPVLNIKNTGKNKPQDISPSDGDSQYITLAGLVLLHPFLQAFFQALDLLNNENNFKDEPHQEKAVQWLYYLGTGASDCPEHELYFCKILCNMPSNQPVGRWLDATESQKNEADALLKALIGHWYALKSTSPDGLRQGFLQRSGRVSKKGDYWQITVERLGQDVLLDQLPWNLSMIKLPWIPTLLRVEW
jgi:Contractile injection system tape measure protein